MKATAIAPANIAFIKYWGKADDELRLPLHSSISMNLSNTFTKTSVEFDKALSHDEVTLLNGHFNDNEINRVIKSLDIIRKKANIGYFAHVITENTFPKGAGAAASASGFAALTVAAFAALGIKLSEKELSIFARIGSGSACRSIPDGFVEWKQGQTSDESYAYSLYPHDYWDLRDILVIVDTHMKKVSTTEGMKYVKTSPFWQDREKNIPPRIEKMKVALKEKNFQALGEIMEEDCLDMHHVMQTQTPPLYYWNDETVVIMDLIKKRTVPAYFTIDAGPNIHIICEGKDEQSIVALLKGRTMIINKPAEGAHLI